MFKLLVLSIALFVLVFASDTDNLDKEVGLIEEKAELKGRYEAQYNAIWHYKKIAAERLEDKKRAEMESYILKGFILLLICFGGSSR